MVMMKQLCWLTKEVRVLPLDHPTCSTEVEEPSECLFSRTVGERQLLTDGSKESTAQDGRSFFTVMDRKTWGRDDVPKRFCAWDAQQGKCNWGDYAQVWLLQLKFLISCFVSLLTLLILVGRPTVLISVGDSTGRDRSILFGGVRLASCGEARSELSSAVDEAVH